MRANYREELDGVIRDLIVMTRASQTALQKATTALFSADLNLAEQVVTEDQKIDDLGDELEQRSFSLLARQAPVAGELRTVYAVVRMTFELERMGDLAAHVAKVARLRFPDVTVPEPLQENFAKMAKLADQMITTAISTLESRNPDNALGLAEADEEMDELRTEHFSLLTDDWLYGVRSAVDCALLGRYYERIADHAVALGRRIVYIITGEAPEGENWPSTF